MQKFQLRLIISLTLLAAITAFFVFDLKQYLSLEFLQSQRQGLLQFYEHNVFTTLTAYMICYIAVTALSLPGATIMTLAGGAVFGLGAGTLAVSFASTIGATLAFLVSRYLLRDFVQTRFGSKLSAINAGIEKEGAFYLFTLRLVPLFPFFMINLLMGITPLRTGKFFLVSQIGMLPGTLVYVNAGAQLASITSVRGILSPGLLLSFALLGIFPLLTKKALEWIESRRSQQ